MTCGIYSIRNILDKDLKEYIGSSKNIKKRINEHKNDLTKNKHHNIHLQRSWDKYGSKCFVFDILKIVNNIDDLLLTEQWYIDNYQPFYNIAKHAEAPREGINHKEETKEKIRLKNLGKIPWNKGLSGYTRKKSAKPIYNKGKTLEELYGKEKAEKIRNKQSLAKLNKPSGRKKLPSFRRNYFKNFSIKNRQDYVE